MLLGDLILFQQGAETSLCGTEPAIGLTKLSICILLCSALLSMLWLFLTKLAKIYMNLCFLLVWSTWPRAWGQDSPTCPGLMHGHDYSYCISVELTNLKRLNISSLFILKLSKLQRKKRSDCRHL